MDLLQLPGFLEPLVGWDEELKHHHFPYHKLLSISTPGTLNQQFQIQMDFCRYSDRPDCQEL